MFWLSSHCVKSVRIQNFTGQYFPKFRLNMETYSVSLRIQSEIGKIRTKKTPNTNTFHAVLVSELTITTFKITANFCFFFTYVADWINRKNSKIYVVHLYILHLCITSLLQLCINQINLFMLFTCEIIALEKLTVVNV